MRFLALVVAGIFATALTTLFHLPGEMAKEYVVARLTELAADYLGIKSTSVETIVNAVWPFAPFLTAVALLFLYHSVNRALLRPKNTLLVEAKEPYPIKRVIGDVFSAIVLIVFVFAVLKAQFSYRIPASSNLRFHSLEQLSNYELRERAFRVATDVSNLIENYSKRETEIFSLYNRQMQEWNKKEDEYSRKLQAHNDWRLSHSYPFGSSLILGSNLGISGFDHPAAPPVDPEPEVPPSTGSKPELPLVTVDGDWRHKADALQEEASAVSEEINHRLGSYPKLFDVPTVYGANELFKHQGTMLRDLANNLHGL